MNNFSKINEIIVDDIDSWQEKLFITFDIDWCSDEVLSFVLDIIEQLNIKVTFFVTHRTKLLKRMSSNKNIELAIHPNFNFLLNGNFIYGKNIEEVIKYYKAIVPNAVTVRSHSLTQSGIILLKFEEAGLKYDCNNFIPLQGGTIKPYMHTEKLCKIPHIYEDDVMHLNESEWNVEKYLKYKGIKVFDFHPIHIFLNSQNIKLYEDAKPYLKDFKKLKNFKNLSEYGTKDFFMELIKKALENG